jgi:hypothetical protein
MSVFSVAVKYGQGESKDLILVQGIPVSEINQLLRSAFNLSDKDVVGLYDSLEDKSFPISLLSIAPQYFATRPKSAPAYSIMTYDGLCPPPPEHLQEQKGIDVKVLDVLKQQFLLRAGKENYIDSQAFLAIFSNVYQDRECKYIEISRHHFCFILFTNTFNYIRYCERTLQYI